MNSNDLAKALELSIKAAAKYAREGHIHEGSAAAVLVAAIAPHARLLSEIQYNHLRDLIQTECYEE